jgi:hypothetical protein
MIAIETGGNDRNTRWICPDFRFFTFLHAKISSMLVPEIPWSRRKSHSLSDPFEHSYISHNNRAFQANRGTDDRSSDKSLWLRWSEDTNLNFAKAQIQSADFTDLLSVSDGTCSLRVWLILRMATDGPLCIIKSWFPRVQWSNPWKDWHHQSHMRNWSVCQRKGRFHHFRWITKKEGQIQRTMKDRWKIMARD